MFVSFLEISTVYLKMHFGCKDGTNEKRFCSEINMQRRRYGQEEEMANTHRLECSLHFKSSVEEAVFNSVCISI